MRYSYFCTDLGCSFETNQKISDANFKTVRELVDNMKNKNEDIPAILENASDCLLESPVEREIIGEGGFKFNF